MAPNQSFLLAPRQPQSAYRSPSPYPYETQLTKQAYNEGGSSPLLAMVIESITIGDDELLDEYLAEDHPVERLGAVSCYRNLQIDAALFE